MTNDHLDRRLRHAVQLDASVTRSGGDSFATTVTDLSVDGCCLTGDYAIGEWVDLDAEQVGSLHGQIRWAVMGRAGLRFAKQDEETTAPR